MLLFFCSIGEAVSNTVGAPLCKLWRRLTGSRTAILAVLLILAGEAVWIGYVISHPNVWRVLGILVGLSMCRTVIVDLMQVEDEQPGTVSPRRVAEWVTTAVLLILAAFCLAAIGLDDGITSEWVSIATAQALQIAAFAVAGASDPGGTSIWSDLRASRARSWGLVPS